MTPRKRYRSDLTEAQWQRIKGRYPKQERPEGRAATSVRPSTASCMFYGQVAVGKIYRMTFGVKGYDSEPLRQALRRRRIIPIVPYRKNHVTVPRGRPPKDRVQGRYTRQRWKVERSFAWTNRFRRLDRLLEHGQKTYRAFIRAFFVKYYLDLLY